MSRGGASSNFQSRFTAIAMVLGGHLVLLGLLTIRDDHGGGAAADERMTLVFIDLPDEHPPIAPPSTPPRTPRPARLEAPATITVPDAKESAAISPEPAPGIDWYANGADAAQRAATQPATRDFSFPKREPAPREKKEFGWDKTHTERVHALDGGGIGIHLSDNCELIIAPFPMAGCALGK